jgi:hypothetical protein
VIVKSAVSLVLASKKQKTAGSRWQPKKAFRKKKLKTLSWEAAGAEVELA